MFWHELQAYNLFDNMSQLRSVNILLILPLLFELILFNYDIQCFTSSEEPLPMASCSSTTSIGSWPLWLCDCEKAYCIVRKAKTRENRGRDYYSCPIIVSSFVLNDVYHEIFNFKWVILHIFTPIANFIQWWDEYQEQENNQFQKPRNSTSVLLKQAGE